MDAGKTARSVLSLALALCLAAPAAYASEPSGGGRLRVLRRRPRPIAPPG